MKDGAMVTLRVLWSLLGVVVYSQNEESPATPMVLPTFRPFPKLPPGISVRSFSSHEFDALSCSGDVMLVLVAANKCVAHIDEYPDHGVSETILDRVIHVTFAEIAARIS